MHRKFLFIASIICLLSATASFGQVNKTRPSVKSVKTSPITNKKPKLVVGLVIDQMRWDYLYRFNALYSANGFKRLLGDGFSCENTFVPYTPTYTAPGHTCIYTGSVPAIHGIVGNNWFEKTINKNVYCTDDSTVSTVGSKSAAGKMSPENMWTTTITDELRLSTNFKSKVIGVALKDRGAILPAGHTANAAYWYDDDGGKWISSTYYMKTLPQWVSDFNAKDLAGTYMSKDWELLKPVDQYGESTADDRPYEEAIKGDSGLSKFPHKLTGVGKNKYYDLRYSPWGTTFTFDFAKKAVEQEKLGAGSVTDFLTVSISSTDYIGHNFGPNSIEVEDMYLRLDLDIADFLKYLDDKLGKDNYLFFLTADHAAAHAPPFLEEHNVPAGYVSNSSIRKKLDTALAQIGVTNAIQIIENYQVYLKYDEIEKQGKDAKEVTKVIIKTLKDIPFVLYAFELDKLAETTIAEPQKTMITNGYNTKRSGDIQFSCKPGYFDGWGKGTSHGTWNPYDSHIPLLFYGWNVKPGKTNRETYMTDIAATIAGMLQIQMPNGCVGKVITEIAK